MSAKSAISFIPFYSGISACLRLRLEPHFKRWAPEPFCAVTNESRSIKEVKRKRPLLKLTRYSGRLGEAAEYLGIYVNAQFLLIKQPLVASLDDGLSPICKRLPHQRVSQVDKPLPWQLSILIRLRQVVMAGLVALSLLKDVFDTEALVLWQRQVLNPVTIDETLATTDDALQKVDSEALVRC